MSEYVCIGCGYVFDEDRGAPGRVAPNRNAMLKAGCGWHKRQDDKLVTGVAPGTEWERVSDGFRCPSCGTGKYEFEAVDGK